MTLTIRFEHGGEISIYKITDAATLTIQGKPELTKSGLLITSASALEIDGVAPWAGIQMIVNISEVNVRHDPSTDREKVTSLEQGFEVTVMPDTLERNGITWREIIAPDDLRGKWIAQQVAGYPEIYLVPVEAGEERAASEASEVKIDTDRSEERSESDTEDAKEESNSIAASAQTVEAQTAEHEPAPLLGRFKLVQKQGPKGTYTALSIDGDDKPKLGVNIREFSHFGIPQWQWAREHGRATYCKTVRDLNMKWVRFFVPHISYNNVEENLKRVEATLDVIRDHDLVAVVTLNDSLADVGMFPEGDAEWHHKGIDFGHYPRDYFNSGAYREHYLPLVKEVVMAFKDHKGVGIWQLMNEPAIYIPHGQGFIRPEDTEGFARWVDETSAMIYDMDKTHPISIGMINSSHIKPPAEDRDQFAVDFYSERKHIHVVTCHAYQSDHNGDPHASWDLEEDCMADVRAAAKTGRAMIWTEFGSSQAGNRRQATERFLNRQLLEHRASAALQWAYMLEIDGISDSGIGDRRFGWSRANFNKEFEELKNLFASYPNRV